MLKVPSFWFLILFEIGSRHGTMARISQSSIESSFCNRTLYSGLTKISQRLHCKTTQPVHHGKEASSCEDFRLNLVVPWGTVLIWTWSSSILVERSIKWEAHKERGHQAVGSPVHATRSMVTCSCYQEHGHMFMLPGAWSHVHATRSFPAATNFFSLKKSTWE